MRRPDFFLVGAPKCGTTALHVALRQHPDIFMPEEKENNHFASDLLRESDPYRSRDHYLALFRDARDETRVGETSVFNLLSTEAARNIRDFEPAARILVMLRDPVEFLASYHSQMLYNGDEVVADLGDALDAEAARARGEQIPEHLRFPERLLYSRVARFGEQLERYLDLFGRDAVHVILHHELRAEPERVVADALAFLGVDPGVPLALGTENPNKSVRSTALSNWLRRPPRWLAAPVTALIPPGLRRALRVRLRRANATVAQRAPLDPALAVELRARFRPEAERVAALLERDLPWCLPSRVSS